jgi:hypothetical protein
MMVNIYPPIKLQKTDTPKSISNIGKSWKDLFAYPFFALTRLHLKTENNKLYINGYTQYLMKSTFENIWPFSQARHFIRLCTILHASGFGLPPRFEDCKYYIYKGVDVVEWSRALDVRLSEWCCSVSMVWVQIPSREEQKFDSSKI